ncbi:MAG: MerR family transcriptional regulator [Acidobacteriota bacterium]
MRETATKTARIAKRWYQASEFARRAGVTVRALHHYDRLGLLKPSGRTPSGYRLYAEQDFARLQQIVTLKFIGFSLTQIKTLLEKDAFDLQKMLRLQRDILAEKRAHLDKAVKAIETAESLLTANEEPNWEAFAKIVEVINMSTPMEWTKKYYSEEARQEIEARAKLWTPELQQKVEAQWNQLFKEIEEAASHGEDPASPKSQAFVDRWNQLVKGFTGGNAEVAKGLNQLYADQTNWPATFKRPWSDAVDEFMNKARAARNP